MSKSEVEIVFESESEEETEIVFEDEEEGQKENSTWTITFSERVENHVGMQTVGNMADKGFSIEEINSFSQQEGYETEIINLDDSFPEECEKAQILIIRNGVKLLMKDESKDLINEIKKSKDKVDKKAWMRGRVVNKLARYNLCYGDESQLANYEEKKGTIISFQSVPFLSKARHRIGELFGNKCQNLLAELNYYYDVKKCGIGFHGDSERRLVIGMRFGCSMDLQYQWFHEGKSCGDRVEITLNEGDIYFMSEKATGTDWKKRKIPTLRHAAGCKKYTTIK